MVVGLSSINVREQWAVYDRDRAPTGRTTERGEVLADGEYRLVVHVCIFDPAGRMLIQKRAVDKRDWPGLWDFSVGGSVIAGESTRAGAAREVREELGVELDLDARVPDFTFTFPHGFDDFYLVRAETDMNVPAVPNAEVTEVRWASRAEVHTLRAARQFIGWQPALIDFLFAAGAQVGAALIDPA